MLLAGVLVSVCRVTAANTAASDDEFDDWLEEDSQPVVPQAGEGELVFLTPPPESSTLHSINTISLSRNSLEHGWVVIDQCYRGLDAVPVAEVVYRYRNLRNLHIQSKTNIGQAVTRDQTVQLTDVKRDASLCIRAEAQILYPQRNGGFVLRNGPFHRRFLDGYFPLYVSLEVRFPPKRLRFEGTSPESQPGFEVKATDQRVQIETWFAGTLHVEVYFSGR